MDTDSPVKDILYQELESITEKKILSELSKNNSSKIILEVISKSFPRIQEISHNIDEDLGILAESLMHYLLTLAMIPGQRKILHQDIEIDIVLPDLKTLLENPKDSIIIYFPKSKDYTSIQKNINVLEKVQHSNENIWVVLNEKLELENKIYLINKDTNSFTKILDDINEFYSSRKQNKFKIMKS